MGDYWTQFAKTGNPNMPPHPEWPLFRIDEQKWMRLGTREELGATGIERKAQYDILQKRLYRHIDRMKALAPEAAVLEK